jgi:N-acetyl-gamma-glutamyl-phosphate reductase
MTRIGIFGATGYMGGEALRILLEHPEFEVAWATSRSGGPIERHHRNLYDADVKLVAPEDITPCDAVLIALPSGMAMGMTRSLVEQNTKVIDLGADFRLKNRSDWERVYGRTHADWETTSSAVYGIPELHRDDIAKANVIANPGCYSSASILGLAPLVANALIDLDRLVIDGLSGTAGAGAEPDLPIHHPEIGNNVVPYNVVDHRHTYEIEQELGAIAGSTVTVHFTTTYVPITRGILVICHCFPHAAMTRAELLDLYRDFYPDEYFVRIFDTPKDPRAAWQYAPYPWVSAVSGTNFCHIGLDCDERRGRIVIFSVLDSIGKGGAHAAVQNLNLMFGLDETTGLKRFGSHPY